jgi:hypothetical protein
MACPANCLVAPRWRIPDGRARRDYSEDVQGPGGRHSRATPFTTMIARRGRPPVPRSSSPSVPVNRETPALCNVPPDWPACGAAAPGGAGVGTDRPAPGAP